MRFDNREALAFLLFCRFNCTRDVALAAVDEMGDMVPAVKKVAAKRWRSRRNILGARSNHTRRTGEVFKTTPHVQPGSVINPGIARGSAP